MVKIKKFDNFNCKINFQEIANTIPDSDIPSDMIQIFDLCDKIIYVEGWCDRCFVNYDIDEDDINSKIEMAKELTLRRLEELPFLPQYKNILSDYKLIDWKFVELPDNQVNYAVSIGVYDKI